MGRNSLPACDHLPGGVSLSFRVSRLHLIQRIGRGSREMTLSSYSDVFSISHERGYDEHIAVGDLVRTGPNLYPHYEVIAVHGD